MKVSLVYLEKASHLWAATEGGGGEHRGCLVYFQIKFSLLIATPEKNVLKVDGFMLIRPDLFPLIKFISLNFHFTQRTLLHFPLLSPRSLPLRGVWPPPKSHIWAVSGPPSGRRRLPFPPRSQQAALWQCSSPLPALSSSSPAWLGRISGAGAQLASSFVRSLNIFGAHVLGQSGLLNGSAAKKKE